MAENIFEKKLAPGPLAQSQGGWAVRMASDVALQGPEERTTDRVPVLHASGQVGSVRACARVRAWPEKEEVHLYIHRRKKNNRGVGGTNI